MTGPASGWQPDPAGRHQYRYWDGTAWTDQVSDDGIIATDPLTEAAPAAPGPAATAGAPAVAAAAPTGTATSSGNKVPLIIGGILLIVLIGAGIWFLTKDDDSSGPGGLAGGGGGSSQSAVAEFFVDSGMSRDDAACIADELDGKVDLQELLAMEESDEPTPQQVSDAMAIVAAVQECGLAGFGVPGADGMPDGGIGGGDTEQLDSLRGACGSGDMEACDELYWASPLGSDHEEFGSTCGGRSDHATFGGCATLSD